MNLNRLHEIIKETTVLLRMGEVIEGTPELEKQLREGQELTAGGVVSIDMMPHHSEAPDTLEKVDMVLVMVGVDKDKAAAIRAELAGMLEEWAPGLKAGPSFIAWGAQVGDQGAALQLMALGKVLGFWGIISPKTIKEGDRPNPTDDAECRYMASMGFLMTTGFTP